MAIFWKNIGYSHSNTTSSEPPCSYTPGAPGGALCGDCVRCTEPEYGLGDWGRPMSPTPWEIPNTPSHWLSPEPTALSGSSDGKLLLPSLSFLVP